MKKKKDSIYVIFQVEINNNIKPTKHETIAKRDIIHILQNMENAEPFYYITESEMGTKVIRMIAPWPAQGKLEIL